MQKKMTLTVVGFVLSLLLVFPALGAETIKIGALYNLTGAKWGKTTGQTDQ